MTVSNAISVFRLLLALPVFLLLRDPWENRWWVLLLFVLAYVSDLADGYIARRFDTVTDAGKILDPLADKVFVFAAVIGLLAANRIPAWFVACVIARDVLILAAGAIIKSRTRIVVASNMTGKVAVVSIGVVLLVSLFRLQLTGPVYTLLLLVSLSLMAASLFVYGQRFFTIYARKK